MTPRSVAEIERLRRHRRGGRRLASTPSGSCARTFTRTSGRHQRGARQLLRGSRRDGQVARRMTTLHQIQLVAACAVGAVAYMAPTLVALIRLSSATSRVLLNT